MVSQPPAKSNGNNAERNFQQLDEYNWTLDEDYQTGLHEILGDNAQPEQVESLTLRARCFYFSRYEGS